MAEVKRKACLIVIDGWGISPDSYGNAILAAKTPVMDGFKKDANWAEVEASGLAVGLPEGLMGNSEVGHLTIGAGQVQYQDLVRVNLAVKNGSLQKNPALVAAFDNAKAKNGRVHFLGLLSDGGVHSHIDHLFALLKYAKEAGVPEAYVQCFMDGRDTPPDSGMTYIEKLENYIKQLGYGKIGTIMGRFYAMDRDKRWDRVKVSYEGLIAGRGEDVGGKTALEVVKSRYEAKELDEFLKPIIVDKNGLIKDNDTMIYFDFRSDRMREPVETFGVKRNFETDVPIPEGLHIVQFTQYSSSFPFPIVFPQQKLENVLSEWISKQGLVQFHTAETEKYAHVTFFFNGGREEAFPNEDRKLVPSPKVPTYDLEPKMNAAGVAKEMVDALATKKYPLVLCNFAPPDMVGHTGKFDKAVIAVEETDRCIGLIRDACKENDYVLLITADHGNAEVMLTSEGQPVTSHTSNPVPFVVYDPQGQLKYSRTTGGLVDVSPTILTVMGLPVPAEMMGSSLI
uniref:phosphoglycerate mutase (2,3-diphosphoglycerate-independent) n=1 Tax=Cyanoptyche gloeocystis TaxID=77922 RepID=A0A7S2JMY2_9EUKA|mmetsp:Transcript_323/g.676  ORF Transcript_323/g.676 Transcript_323/m.676 type:complete len:510 (+) Transcript_323:59-1588(+)|eukprot:CAMPEP_0196657382 /NCGR_PEP_ID=MMETSP1086-20130531/22968_1 /TAXON_ID=77921 /ORGANISM="Cyanoptyche  gloeocystis , Strain SAG4.97" /LENGTH=509 /DNA_ID=CAMNT_0041990471 /DNA_START=44 /DNA_END=1573 /DNA_ORIENTATION=-